MMPDFATSGSKAIPATTSSGAANGVSRREVMLHGLLAATAIGVGGWAEKDAGAGTLRVSSTGKDEGDFALLLRAAGIRPDMDVRYSNFDSSNLVVEALNGGSLDYGTMSEIPPVFAAASTIHSFKQIAVAHNDVNGQALLVPKGSRIQALVDLKGKRVAYAARGRRDGFTGMMAIHPSQIAIINAAFSPDAEAVAGAEAIVAAFAASPSSGALQLGERMIDAPHLRQAMAILDRRTNL